VRSLSVIPFDGNLAEGAEISLDLMGHKTRQAYAKLATSITEDFAQ
jgi:hypothetical protein